MNTSAFLHSRDGFTLNEMLVAIIVGGLVVSFGMSVFVFSNKIFHSWNRKTAVRDAVERTVQSIAADVLKSSDIIAVSDTSLDLQAGVGMTMHYAFVQGIVARNGQAIVAGNQEAMAVNVRKISPQGGSELLEISAVAQGATEHTASVQVALKRNARRDFRGTQSFE